MFHLISLVGSGISYLINRREDKEKTEEHTDTQDTEDPVQTDSLLDPGLECEDETQTDSAVPQESVNEAEEKSQKVEESGSLLDDERSIVEERVRELEELLCEREREYERKQEVTLAESEEKHEQAMKYVEHRQKRDADLKFQVDTLKDKLQDLGNCLSQKHTKSTETTRLYERELNLHKHVQSRSKQKNEKFNKETRSLMVAVNEAKRKFVQEFEASCQLERLNSRLWSDLWFMLNVVLELDEELSQPPIGYNEMRTECEREKEPHSVLKVDQVTHHEELPQGIQAGVSGLYREMTHDDPEFHDQLKRKEDELKEANKLQELVQQLERELSKSHKRCEEIKRECENDEEHDSVLKCDQMTSTDLMELAQVSQPESEHIAQLENETSNLMSLETTLQDSLQGLSNLLTGTNRKCKMEVEKYVATEGMFEFVETQAEKQKSFLLLEKNSFEESLDKIKIKYLRTMNKKQEVERNIEELLNELDITSNKKYSLSDELEETEAIFEERMEELRKTTHHLRELEPEWKYFKENVMKNREDELHAHKLLKVQYSEMKQKHNKLNENDVRLRQAYSTLESQYEELKQHGSQMECKCKQEQEQESSSHTEESGSVNRQQGSVQQLEGELTEIERKCDEMERVKKGEQEQYDLLKARCQKIKEELTEIQRKCDKMERETEGKQEQYDLLKARCQQLEESLQEYQELLKILSPDL